MESENSSKRVAVRLTENVAVEPNIPSAEQSLATSISKRRPLEARFPGRRKCTDDDIAQKCNAVLRASGSVPAKGVKVAVSNHQVTLSGEVEWHYQAEAAVIAIRKLPGVVKVTNNIAIKSCTSVGGGTSAAPDLAKE